MTTPARLASWRRPLAWLRCLRSADRATVAIAAALGLTMIALGAVVPADWWTGFFAHPLRVERLGAIPQTTREGAMAWRIALIVGGATIPILVIALAILGCRGDVEAREWQDDGADSRPPAGSVLPRQATSRPSRAGSGMLRLEPLALIGLLVLGTIVRAPRLVESLWYDEIAAFLDFSQFGPGVTSGNYFAQSNHVFQGVLSWLSMVVAGGADELSLRVPTLIASLLAVLAFFGLGREATNAGDVDGPSCGGSWRALPWLLAWIAALSPIAVLEAVEARGYAFMILAAVLATTLFLRGLRRPTATTWTLYALVMALGAWSHLVTICVALGHGAIVAWMIGTGAWRSLKPSREQSEPRARAGGVVSSRPGSMPIDAQSEDVRSGPRAGARGSERRARDLRGAFAAATALALAAIGTIVLYAPALPDMLAIRSEFRALDGNEPTLFGPEGVHALYSFGGAWYGWSALPAALCAALGVVACARHAALRRAAAAALAGLPVAVALAWLGDSWLYARFLLLALPGAALLIAAGIAAILARSRLAGALTVIVVGSFWIADLALRPPKQPLREAVFEVAAARGPRPTAGDAVATIGLADNVLAWYGLLRGIDIVSSGPLGRDLDAVLQRVRPRFVIVLYEHSVGADRFDLLARRGYTLRTRHHGWVDWTNGDVLVFERAAIRDQRSEIGD